MKITDVRNAALKDSFEWILVRVYTDAGLVGLGECYLGAGVARAHLVPGTSFL
jgi:D-xylonate dehydratase